MPATFKSPELAVVAKNGNVSENPKGTLAALKEAGQALERMSIHDTLQLHHQAAGIETTVKAAKMGLKVQNDVAEVRLKSERKVGKWLSTQALHGGDRKSKNRDGLTLKKLGISRDDSKRWQELARVPDKEFHDYVEVTKENEELTRKGAIRKHNERLRRQREREEESGDGGSTQEETHSEPLGLLDDLLDVLVKHVETAASLVRPVVESTKPRMDDVEARYYDRLVGEVREIVEKFADLPRNGFPDE